MKFKFCKRQIYYFICFCVILSSAGASLIAGIHKFEEGLWILPLLYAMCFVIVGDQDYYCKYSIVIVNVIAFIRYVLLIYMYYLMNDDYVLPNGAVILSYISEKLVNPVDTVMAMSLEMLIFYVCIFVAARIFFREECCIAVDKQYGLLSLGVVTIGILILMAFPQLIGLYRIITSKTASALWGGLVILIFVAKVYLIIWLVRFVQNRKSVDRLGNVLVVSVLLGILMVESAIGMTGAFSRWGFILAVIPGLYLIHKSYPRYFGVMLTLFGVVGVSAIVIMTILRFNLSDASVSGGFVQRMINFKAFNSYFGGEVNMEIAFRTEEIFRDQISLRTVVNDILGACPFVNKLLNNRTDNTVYFFNYTIYRGHITGDQICPLGGQSMLYFGRLGVGILAGIFAILAVWFEGRAERSSSILNKYVYVYCMGVTAIIMCININIWFQFFWQKMFPLLIIMKFDYTKMRFKR